MPDSTCPGCGQPVAITTERQRRRLAGGGIVYHNRECQQAAGQETRACNGCGTPVTRRKSGFTDDGAVACSAACRGAIRRTKQVRECDLGGCDARVTRPVTAGENVYCSREHSAAAKRGGRALVPCAYDGVPFLCDNRRAGRGTPVYCSREHQKAASRVELSCATGGCENTVTRFRSQLPADREPRVFCDSCCLAGASFKPRKGTSEPCACGCGQLVYRRPSEPADRLRYVDMDHKAVGMRGEERVTRVTRHCTVCGSEMRLSPDQLRQDQQTCSTECAGAARRREPGERYVDKRTGYAIITAPDGRAVAEHRYVMEQVIGRPLLASENVHHKAGGFAGRSNNNLSNLELWTRRQPAGHRIEDVVAYCREMLAVYGDHGEQDRYASHQAAVLSEATGGLVLALTGGAQQ